MTQGDELGRGGVRKNLSP